MFHIGHSDSESMTFLPQVRKKGDGSDSLYVDIAGQQDTGGELIEFINIFVTKELFRKAHKVRFLVPIPQAQVADARGKGPREQIQVIQQICQASLDTIIHSIQPILTKCKKDDDELQIDAIRETLKEQFRLEVKTQ